MIHYLVDAIVAYRYPEQVREYSANLHIFILGPHKSDGTKLIEALCAKLRSNVIPGAHLGATEDNHKALMFYGRVKFEPCQGCGADGRKRLLKDKISNGAIDVTGMCMVKRLRQGLSPSIVDTRAPGGYSYLRGSQYLSIPQASGGVVC